MRGRKLRRSYISFLETAGCVSYCAWVWQKLEERFHTTVGVWPSTREYLIQHRNSRNSWPYYSLCNAKDSFLCLLPVDSLLALNISGAACRSFGKSCHLSWNRPPTIYVFENFAISNSIVRNVRSVEGYGSNVKGPSMLWQLVLWPLSRLTVNWPFIDSEFLTPKLVRSGSCKRSVLCMFQSVPIS